MAINVSNSNYSGEVLESILTKATTGNELVERGLIRMEPGVEYKFSIPRIKTGKMLQKRKEQPGETDSKGDFSYSEVTMEPKEFMAFTTFNPRSFEKIWRKWQPKGNLVFSQLPPEAQNALLSELAKTCNFEVGDQMINGEYAETGDEHLFNGLVKRMSDATDKIIVKATAATMIEKLKAVRKAIPNTLRKSANLRIIMSQNDADKYDEELSAQSQKGTNWTDTNASRFKGITIEALAQWPDDLIVATITGMGLDTNLWAACNLVNDIDVIQIDKLTNAGEKYFFKVLIKMDTQIAFGDDVVWCDGRGIVTDKDSIEFPKAGATANVVVTAPGDYTVSANPTGYTVTKTDTGIKIVAAANSGASDVTGKITLTLTSDGTKKAEINLKTLH